jgi:hypothetical protein
MQFFPKLLLLPQNVAKLTAHLEAPVIFRSRDTLMNESMYQLTHIESSYEMTRERPFRPLRNSLPTLFSRSRPPLCAHNPSNTLQFVGFSLSIKKSIHPLLSTTRRQ